MGVTDSLSHTPGRYAMKAFSIYLLIVNAAALFLYGLDKYRAVRHKWRIPERVLILAAALGGSAGALLGMYAFHHKTQKPLFRIGVPLILIVQTVIIFLLRQYL